MDDDYDLTQRDLERIDHTSKRVIDDAYDQRRKDGLRYKHLSEVKAKRHVRNKNKRARRVHERIGDNTRRRYGWNVKTNFRNPCTCYEVGGRFSPGDVLPSAESLMYQATSRREEEILIRLVDRASRYVLENKSRFLVVEYGQKWNGWRYYRGQTKDYNNDIKVLLDGDISDKIHALNSLSNKDDILGLAAINDLCSLEIDEAGELELLVGGNERKFGPRKRRLKSKRKSIMRELVCRIPDDERVVNDVDDLRSAIRSIVRKEAKADHYVVEADGRSDLFLYLLKETQSRFDRGFVVDPDRMVKLDYARVKRGALDLLDDVREYLKHAIVVSSNGNGQESKDKPPYINNRLLVNF